MFQTIRRRSEMAAALIDTLCHFAQEQERDLYLVGGLIRDFHLGDSTYESTALDLDLAVDGDPAPFHAALSTAAHGQVAIHDRFGTASGSLADGTRVDLAQTRRELYPAPGALPVVAPAPIDVDLWRRDFTVNAAALTLSGDRAGQLIDPYGAALDLERRLIRTLHPDSFQDDPTRLIRAARYASRIGGTVERRTAADARRHRGHLGVLSAGRFGDAWRLLLREPDPVAALRVARRLKLPQSRDARWFVPKLAFRATDSTEQFWASMGLLSRQSDISDWLPRSTGMNRSERTALLAGAQLRAARRSIGRMRRPSSLARALSRYPLNALTAAERIWSGSSGASVSSYLERQTAIQSPISAPRLLELGVERGPRLGRWLEVIQAAIWDGELDPDDRASVARMEQQIRLSR